MARLSVTGSPGFFIIVPVAERDEILSIIEAAGAVHADEDASRIVRLEHGKPRDGEDISERYLAQEANQADALHFHKVGYLGQEIVERLRSRGLIQRVLKPLEIDGQMPPEPRTKLQFGGAPPPRSPRPPTLPLSEKWLRWATYGWSTPSQGRR